MSNFTGEDDGAGHLESNRTYAPNLITSGDQADTTTLDASSFAVAITPFSYTASGTSSVTDDERKLVTMVSIKIHNDVDGLNLSSPLFGDYVLSMSDYKTGDIIFFQPYMIFSSGTVSSITTTGTATTGSYTVYVHYQALGEVVI